MATIADSLAEFAVGTSYDSIPQAVIDDNKLRLLDSLGAAISSSREAFGRDLLKLAQPDTGGTGCTALMLAQNLAVDDAAMVNACLIHGQDYDDTHTETLIHVSSTVASTAFALAEHYRLTGSELLRLTAIGYETAIRIGLGSCPNAQIQARGFHGTAIAGAPAAAVLTSLARGLDKARLRDALAIATGLGSGLRQSVIDGSFAKAIQPGWAVKTGMWSASVAAVGVTGPDEIFEGKRGLYASHANLETCDIGRVCDQLGSRWDHLMTDFKLYPVCHYLQATAEAAIDLRAEAQLGTTVPIDQIERVDVDISAQVLPAVCEPTSVRFHPTTDYGAKFSLQFSVAACLVYGALTEAELVRGMRDPIVPKLAARVVHHGVPNPEFPKLMPIRMVLTLKDGRTISREYASSPGAYGRTVLPHEIEDKFRRNALPSLGESAVEAFIERMRDLEKETDVRDLVSSLPIAAGNLSKTGN